MDAAFVRQFLDDPTTADAWLSSRGVDDVARARQCLSQIAKSGVPFDLLVSMWQQFEAYLPHLSDPEMALLNLDRFMESQRSPMSLASLFERDEEALPVLLQIFSMSQYLSDLLVSDIEAFDLLRLTEGQPVTRDALVDEICSEIQGLQDDHAVLALLRRFKRREILRVAYGDIIGGQQVVTVAGQISYIADAIVEAAVQAARRTLSEKWGQPITPDGRPARFVVLGLGKLGGTELNYSSDIDLMFVYDQDGRTDGRRHASNQEYFERLCREVTRLLTVSTGLGIAYRVDLRLRPEGSSGSIVISQDAALRYYETLGRTWERQAFVKCRPVAGDLEFGREFLAYLEPWIYRRFLTLADITGIKALKRRIEQATLRDGGDLLDVKTGHGGIRDIEFVIQFLQLLNGGDLPRVRTGNTVQAIAELQSAGCLTADEASHLEANYGFLRKIEHRLQIMFDLQTHRMPANAHEMARFAIRMGHPGTSPEQAREDFQRDYENVTRVNRKVLNHLLHEAFEDDRETEPEVDLVLDPNPSEERIHEILDKYRFDDIPQAYRNLMALSQETIRFLSTRRCRHFLAAIAPSLLRSIDETPDPDLTLNNLSQVSDSLGGKGALWELFSVSPPSLRLYVDLCASSPFLTSILTTNPGMIDELLDSLLLDKLPSFEALDRWLADLCRHAEDIEPILHSFKNAQQLSVGVRHILHKEEIESITGVLSDIAQACLGRIIEHERRQLVRKLGQPRRGESAAEGEDANLIVLAMGKLGGRELNYHSDLDLVFLYDEDGHTRPAAGSRPGKTTTNQHFFSELGQRIIKASSHMGPYGRLYEVDARLRPTGRSGVLSTSLEGFAKYFASGTAQFWERQALCKARIVHAPPALTPRVREVLHDAAFGPDWRPDDSREVYQMRRRLEQSAGQGDLKRGAGGIVDIEFLAQMLQLRHGREYPEVREPSTLAALAALQEIGILPADDAQFFAESYRFLRNVEAWLRLMNAIARDELPSEPDELARLAALVGYKTAEDFQTALHECCGEIRQRFDSYFDAEHRTAASG